MAKKKQKTSKKAPQDSRKKSPARSQATRVPSDKVLRKRLKKAVRSAEKAAERAERAAGKAKKRARKAAKAVASAATSPFDRATTSDRSAVDKGTGGRSAAAAPPLPPKPEPVSDLHELTRVQLLERARTAEIRGRSSMSKEQLVTALRARS